MVAFCGGAVGVAVGTGTCLGTGSTGGPYGDGLVTDPLAFHCDCPGTIQPRGGNGGLQPAAGGGGGGGAPDSDSGTNCASLIMLLSSTSMLCCDSSWFCGARCQLASSRILTRCGAGGGNGGLGGMLSASMMLTSPSRNGESLMSNLIGLAPFAIA